MNSSTPSQRLRDALNAYADRVRDLRDRELKEYGHTLPHGSERLDWYNDCVADHEDYDDDATEAAGHYDGTVIATDGVEVYPCGDYWRI